jgi:nicotinate-nucleotide pyrophosphorylase (carboxylating)
MSAVLVPDRQQVAQDVAHALREDVGTGDINAALISGEQLGSARIITREDCVLSGKAWASLCFSHFDPSAKFAWEAQDGEFVSAGTTLVTITASARALLTGERSALNFLQTLSATASKTRHYSQLIAHTKARVLDTRKTIPGLRYAQKYAVRCGGGVNHRFGLYDAFLLKENHIAAAGSIALAVARARNMRSDVPLEVEVENLTQLQECLDLGVKRVLLDNFSISDTKIAVQRAAQRMQLEASGNIDESTLREYAEAGVDFISIGALTKHVRAIDLSMRFTSTSG